MGNSQLQEDQAPSCSHEMPEESGRESWEVRLRNPGLAPLLRVEDTILLPPQSFATGYCGSMWLIHPGDPEQWSRGGILAPLGDIWQYLETLISTGVGVATSI